MFPWFTRHKVISFSLLFAYLTLLNVIIFHTPFTIFFEPQLPAIEKLEYLESDLTEPDQLPTEGWQAAKLPDDWAQRNTQVIHAWYRTSIEKDGSDTESIWAVYLPMVFHNAAVYVNGLWVGQGGSFDEPLSRLHNQPLLINFSSSLLRKGENLIQIRIQTTVGNKGLLDRFYIGPANELRSAYEWRRLVRFEFIQWITAAMYFMSMIVLAFWLARPRDVVYALFSLELFLWATHNQNLFITNVPISTRLWEAIILVTFLWTIVTMIFFNHNYVGYANKKVEKITLYFALFSSGLLLLPDINSVHFIGYHILDTGICLLGIYAISHLIYIYYHEEKNSKTGQDAFLMLLVGIPIMISGFHDYLLLNNLISRLDGLIVQYSVIPSIMLFSWFMIQRFVSSINKAEEVSAMLEQRVLEKQIALESQYQELRILEQKRLLSEERERIMRDMHDGIGGQLVSIVSQLQDKSGAVFDNIRDKIQHSLTDLRLVIDSLDPVLCDLPTLLGMMRMRFEDQLSSANIQLEWAVTDLPENSSIGPGECLHIMRILQEAINNSAKYSGSNKLTLATGVLANEHTQVYIDIIDYGSGLKDNIDTNKPGRGIKNMNYRAKQLGANLEINSSPTGTQVRLVLSALS
jgi:signal transduction histidine kinase